MKTRKNPKCQFAICTNTDDPDLITPCMIYQVLPDETAKKSNYIRIIYNEGEDYLYPAENFVFVEFTPKIKEALLHSQKMYREKVKV